MFENLTALQLLNLDFSALGDPKVLLINLTAFLLGLLLNTLREMKREGIGFLDYWTKHTANSVTSIGALAATFISMMTAVPQAPLYAFFSIAFVGDALLNKAPVDANANVETRGLFGKSHHTPKIIEKHLDHPAKLIGLGLLFVVAIVLVV